MYRILKYMRPEVDEIVADLIPNEKIAKLFLAALIDNDRPNADSYRIAKIERKDIK